MYSVLTKLVCQQIPSDDFPNRNLIITIPTIVSYSGKSGWNELASTMTFVIPKNAKYRATNAHGGVVALGSINKSIGGYVYGGGGIDGFVSIIKTEPIPTFLRGDVITFDIGWRARMTGKDNSEVTYMTGDADPTGNYKQNLVVQPSVLGIPNLFKGVISKVSPRLPFTIECEDVMWLLKYIPTPNKTWGSKTLQAIAQEILDSAKAANPDGSISTLTKYNQQAGIDIKISAFSTTDLVFNVQSFITQRGSLYGMLTRIKHQYHIDSYFRQQELRIGLTHYLEQDAIIYNFEFQKNILDGDSLKYKRKDDEVLSCIVKSIYSTETGSTTKDGEPKTKQEHTEILVYVDDKGGFTFDVKKKGVEFPQNEVGKRFTYFIFTDPKLYPVTDPKYLFKMGVRYLKKYYYDGLTGSFTTFGIPYVKHGDVINIANGVLPEMNGLYMVKEVNYHGGFSEGLKQDITLDYKIDSLNDIESYAN